MTPFQRKIALKVLSVHAAIIFLVAVVPLFKGCFKPKPKEIVTFIEFGDPAPQVEVEQVTRMADPEPPPPEPAPIPEPVKPKPAPVKPKPKVEKPTPKPKPKEPEKPKWKPVDPKSIKIGKKVNEAPSKPTVTASEIKQALSGISSGPTGDPSQFNDYYARIMTLFKSHWTPPATATSATGSTVVKISMLKNGTITKRVKIKGSGDALYDRTVMEAVTAVSILPQPPSNYPYDYVEVTFTRDN